MLWEQQEWPLPSTDHWHRPAHSGLRREEGEGRSEREVKMVPGRGEGKTPGEGNEEKRWQQDIISCSYYNEVISRLCGDGGFLSCRYIKPLDGLDANITG